MEKPWSQLSADEKLQQRFETWLAPRAIEFVSPEAQARYRQRVKRLIDVISLKEPDRVPVVISPAHAPARYSGFTVREVMYDHEKLFAAWQKYIDDLDHDVLPATALIRCGRALDILNDQTYKWPGHGLPDDGAPQYVEYEGLKADEWDYLNSDPSDFQIRAYLPRVYGAARALSKLPPLSGIGLRGAGLSALGDPEVKAALAILAEAGQVEEQWRRRNDAFDRKGIAAGLPRFSGSMAIAPLDGLGANLRGTKGTIMDMFKQPQRLLDHMERQVPVTVRSGVAMADMSGVPVAFIPMHRGADGFMSEKQFLTFYWPFLKRVVLGLISEGVVPYLFAEGGYSSRLHIIQELPPGKVIWHFDQTDMALAKQSMGTTACIMGNIPASLMITGTPQQVKERCRQLIETAGAGGGYILAPGASSDQARIENIRAVMEAAREYGEY